MLRSADTVGELSRPAGLQQRLSLTASLLHEAPASAGPRLLWRDRHGVVNSRQITGEVILGRESDCDVVFGSNRVSRRHCRLWPQAGAIWVEDLTSTHGTQVNGEMVKQAMLRDGDQLGIGTHAVVFVAGDGEGR
jgi:pSer/pThr/pTyr-binding forkhead associated (FHA) protein